MSDMGRETRDERRAEDRRQAERESMRTNPEVMGRTEPVRDEDQVRGRVVAGGLCQGPPERGLVWEPDTVRGPDPGRDPLLPDPVFGWG